jgi:hypothetical protein
VPSINGITPNSGPAAGGTFITLVGTGLSSVTRALFGSTSVTVYPYYGTDDTHLYIYTPPGTPGSTVDIKVVNPAGTSAASAADRYTYLARAAPSVRAVLPNRGPAAGGTGVTIFGHGLAGTTTVHFGAVPATINYQPGDESIFVNSPTGTAGTTVDVTVTTPWGTSPVVNADRFTYSGAITPRVDAISPNRGPAVGGQNISLFGAGFAGATSVAFGTVAASFTVYDDGNINATAPAGTAGTVVDVRVTTSAGTSGMALQDQYRYLSLGSPEVDAVTPNRGPAAGGTSVIIVGSGLFNPTSVMFGATPATTFSASSDGTVMTATSPSGTAGTTVDIVVTTSGGSSPAGSSDRFTYLAPGAAAPVIYAIDPNHGSQYGGASVTIHGSGFTTTGMTVMFGTTSVANFIVYSSDTINVYSTPAGSAGTTVDVTVSTASGTSAITAADRYTFDAVAAPAITAISPSTAAAGESVFVTGSGVGSANSVSFGTTPAFNRTLISSNVIQVVVPGGTLGSTVDVRVTNPAGTSAIVAADHFTYSATPPPAPTVSAIGPTAGSAAGGVTVYISGTSFHSGITSVSFGTTPAASYYAFSDGVIRATTPAHAVGMVDVTVANASGTSAINAQDAYTFTTPPVPSVASISPNGGPSNGGGEIYVAGSGFGGATSVSFGNAVLNSGTDFTVNSDSLITAYRSPAQGTNPSTVDVTVTAPGGTSPTATADRFTFGAPVVPTVGTISPTAGPTAGGTAVFITGTGFTGATAVNFGATTVTALAVISDTLISVSSPAQGTNPATVHVTVTARGSTSGTTSADQFTWGSPPGPAVNGVSPNQGMTLGGQTVTVYGSGLTGATVKFGIVSGAVQYGADNQLVVRSPAESAGTVDITVTTGAGTSTTSAADHFTFVAPSPPVINAVDPHQGPTAGGGSLTIYGHGFSGATAVHFGANLAPYWSFYASDDNHLQINQIPPGSVGTVDVTVTTSGGTSSTVAPDHYTYITPGTPAVYAISPNRGSTFGGNSVTIFGIGLGGAIGVTFGTAAAYFYPVYADTQLNAQTPPGAVGMVDVTVATAVGSSAHQAADHFTFVTPGAPAVGGAQPGVVGRRHLDTFVWQQPERRH